jgi:hypothetical protein
VKRADALRNQDDIRRDAAVVANERMRLEVLPRLVAPPEALAVLAREWAPFRPDLGEGFEASLKTTDALVLQLMRDPGLLDEAKGIYEEETVAAMFNSPQTPTLLRAVMEDLLAPGKGALYEATDER